MSEVLHFTVPEIKNFIHRLTAFFHVVRLVDPEVSRLICLDEEHGRVFHGGKCYMAWGNMAKCQNCISHRACHEQCRAAKFEHIREEVFYVMANPVCIKDIDGISHTGALEMVNILSDENRLDAISSPLFTDKIYEDSLARVYNRRYFDEKLYLDRLEGRKSPEVTFLMVDIYRFKAINDYYGHVAGDKIIRSIGAVLRNNTGSHDAVIRYGGDEFLVILSGGAERAEKKMTVFRQNFNVLNTRMPEWVAIMVNMGYCSTTNFDGSNEVIRKLLVAADHNMYADKKLMQQQAEKHPGGRYNFNFDG